MWMTLSWLNMRSPLTLLPFLVIAAVPTAIVGEQSGISDQAVASLQRPVDASYREARETFLFNEDFAEEGADRRPFTLAVDGWKRRQAACVDNRCRLVELTAQLDRLNFANGTGHRPVTGMPWRTGSFQLSARDMAGSLSILPVGDGSIVASITTYNRKPHQTSFKRTLRLMGDFTKCCKYIKYSSQILRMLQMNVAREFLLLPFCIITRRHI